MTRRMAGLLASDMVVTSMMERKKEKTNKSKLK
jgi:hypothetical protein